MDVAMNCTTYANIYVFKEDGKTIGTAEVKIAGKEGGRVFCNSYCFKYNRRDIRKFYNKYMKGELK